MMVDQFIYWNRFDLRSANSDLCIPGKTREGSILHQSDYLLLHQSLQVLTFSIFDEFWMSEVGWLSNIPAQASHCSTVQWLTGAHILPQVRQSPQYTATVHHCALH